jgi:hypothetical protein
MSKARRIVNTAMKGAAATLHLAMFLQPVLAGQYFAGNADALGLHGSLGEIAAWLALGQAGFALCLVALRDMRLLTASGFVAIFAMTGLQVHLGHASSLSLHIPLGACLLALSLLTTVWLFRCLPAAAEG